MPRDASATRSRLLDAARDEFAARGLAGARVDAIAARACANKQGLYAHYGDKAQLFATVLADQLAQLHEAVALDPRRLPESAGDLFDFYAGNPALIRLLQWEALELGHGPVPDENHRSQLVGRAVEAIAEAQRAGTVHPDADPRQLLFNIIGLVAWWFAVPQSARMIEGGDPYSPDALARRRAAVVDAVRRLLEVRN